MFPAQFVSQFLKKMFNPLKNKVEKNDHLHIMKKYTKHENLTLNTFIFQFYINRARREKKIQHNF